MSAPNRFSDEFKKDAVSQGWCQINSNQCQFVENT
jgi:hypothetical protein